MALQTTRPVSAGTGRDTRQIAKTLHEGHPRVVTLPVVEATCASPVHGFSKQVRAGIELEAGLGVVGDVHAGVTTQHLYLKKKAPATVNLTQVHLLHAELLDRLGLTPGEMGENVTTRGLDLHGMPAGTRLRVGGAVLEVTGYRVPCAKINGLRPGLMRAVFGPDGRAEAGVMAVVVGSGSVRPGDVVVVEMPPLPHRVLGPV